MLCFINKQMSVFLGQVLFHAGWKALHNLGGQGHTKNANMEGCGVVKSALPLTGWDEGLFQASLLACPTRARAL